MLKDTSYKPRLPSKSRITDPEVLHRYLESLQSAYTRFYDNLEKSSSGTFRTNTDPTQANWTPILKGTTTAGSFSYTHQIGTVLRQNLLVDCWFSVKWSGATTATGNLYLELPYKVAKSNEKPFIGVIIPSQIDFTSTSFTAMVIQAIPDTYRGEVWLYGDGAAANNQTCAALGSSDQKLEGTIRYLGQEYEQ